MKESVLTFLNNVKNISLKEMSDFLKNYGSHFFSSITIGDSIFQVYALSTNNFNVAKSKFTSRKIISNSDVKELYNNFLVPWAVKDTGKILVASGNQGSKNVIDNFLVDKSRSQSTPNILKLVEFPEILRKIESDYSAVIGAKFSTLSKFMPHTIAKSLFDLLVNNYAELWEANM